MKTQFTIIFFTAIFQLQAQVCEPNEISTNPTSATNPNAPTNAYINDFNWFQQAVNNVLFDVPLNNMTNYYSVSAMLNPYNPSNTLYNYLEEADLDDLDVYPEDGWELLFFNLGTYPDGTSYASANTNVPYIILYNRYRSIVRVFANAKFLQTGFDEVRITLKFDEEFDYSGLFRTNSGLDRTLDQPTSTPVVTTLTRIPNAQNAWFHSDFQVAYDPCTCIYDSRLIMEITPITSTQIEITNDDFSSVEIDLRDNNGLDQTSAIIPVAPRMITFHTMAENVEYSRVIAEKYLQRMQDEGFDASWYESLYSIHALLEVLAHAETNVIGGTEISDAAQHTADMRVQWGLNSGVETPQIISDFVSDVEAAWGMLPAASWSYNPGTYQYTLDLEQVAWYCQQNLPTAQSFSSLAITTSEDKNEFSITPSSAYGSSAIQLQTDPPGNTETVNLLIPGTYPIQENDVTFPGVTAQNYPVYNEVLGLFAVLEQPRLDIYRGTEVLEDAPYPNETCSSCSCNRFDGSGSLQGPFIVDRYTYSETYEHLKCRLSEPLRIVYNPAANINVEEIKVVANISIHGFTEDSAIPETRYYMWNFLQDHGPDAFVCTQVSLEGRYFQLSPVLSDFNFSTTVNNLHESVLSETNNQNDLLEEFNFTSNPSNLEFFNSQVFEITTKTTQKWQELPRLFDTTSPQESGEDEFQCWFEPPSDGYYCMAYPTEELDAIIDVHQTDVKRSINFSGNTIGFIDLVFEIPISTGSTETIFQKVRYPLSVDQNTTNTEFFAEWSDTENPNEVGVYGLEEIAYFNTYDWQVTDIETRGGEFLVPPSSSPAIMPSALHSVNITGSQTKDLDVAEVIFKAEDHISVYGDATLPLGFTLRIEDLVSETSIPTPSVTETELTAFCEGLGGNTYSANQRSVSADGQVAKPIKVPAPVVSVNLQAYPNPTSSTLNLSLLNFNGQVQFDIYNAIGNNLQSFSKTLDGSRGMNYVACSTDDLPNGTYTIVARMSDGTSTTQQFVVLK